MKQIHPRPAIALVIALLILAFLSSACAPKTTPAPATAAPAVATIAPTTAPTSPTAPAGQPAAPLDGHWEGAVDVAGVSLLTYVDFKTEGGALKGTVDFPQQNALSIPLEKVSQQGSKIHFEVLPSPRTAIFEAELQGGDKMTGSFEQAGYKGTFGLQRKVKATETLPYQEKEVKFQNGAITLAGALTLPAGAGPFPAVVLISGSGSQNRNEEIFGFPIFRVLADHLTRQGIAVLRFDDRGLGGSSAGSPDDTSETYAGDVSAAVQYLKTRPEINPKQIGLLGHSEGGIIAPLVATRSSDVAFIVMMAGPGLPGRQILVEQTRLILKAENNTDAQIEKQAALQQQAIEAGLTGKGWDEVKAAMRAEYEAAWETISESDRKTLGDKTAWIDKNIQAQVSAMEGAWMKFFLSYDPAPALEKVAVPVLALFGELDTQVAAESNRAAVMAALDKGGNKDHTAKVFPDANHLFQSAKTGSPGEYATLKAEFTAGFLDTISQWILAHAK